MSTYPRSLQEAVSAQEKQSMFATVKAEMADHYVEVEREGLSLSRLACIYIAGVQEATLRTLHGVRGLFGLRAAH